MGVALALGVSNALAVEDISRAAEPSGAEKAKPAAVRAAKNELLVKFKDRALPRENTLSTLRAALPAVADQALGMLQAEVIEANPQTGLVHLRYGANMSVLEAARLLEKTGTVFYAEPNYLVGSGPVKVREAPAPQATLPRPGPMAVTVNDPRFPEQWALNNTGQRGWADADIDALEAWNVIRDASTTIVAVLSTGIDYKHPDLKTNIWKNPGETSCIDKIDNDKNGYIDDCYGMDAYLNSGDPLDDNGLGTHMAGIVGAVGGNGIGITGVAWKTQLMALRYKDSEGWGWVADAIQAIDYAIKIKVKNPYPRMVLLVDYISAPYSKALNDILNSAESNGILVIAPATYGDNQDKWTWSPSSWYGQQNIIGVSGSDATDDRVYGYGAKSVDLAAPATDILSTWLTSEGIANYKLASGTEMAAAHVAGGAALVWSKNRAFNWKRVKGLLLNGSENGLRGAFNTGYNLTQGRMNLNTSLSSALLNLPAVFAVNPEITQTGQPVTLTGINFGAIPKTLMHKGPSYNNCDYTYPASSIISWENERIVARVQPGCEYGEGLLKVSIATGRDSRGAFFRTNGNPKGYTHWLSPTHQGQTLRRHQEAAYTQVGNDIWIMGGSDDYSDTSGAVERFSLLTLRGEVRPEWEMPMPVRLASAAAIGTKIYVVGGYDDSTKKTQWQLQVFDTTTGIWTRGRNLPKALRQASVIAVDGKLWVMGGVDPNNTGLKTTYVYDPKTNIWLPKAPMPLKRAYAGVATPQANKIWLISGYEEESGNWQPKRTVMVYDILTNSWEIRDDIPLNGAHAAGAAINIGAKTFMLYGSGDSDSGEWLPSPGPSEGLAWSRNIERLGGSGPYTPMIGRIGNTIYVLSGSREWDRRVVKFESP
jgi:subtilisin family serine protease